MGKEAFLIYTNFYKPLSYMTDEQLGRLLRALFQYNIGETPEMEVDIRVAYEFIINQLELDEQKRQERISKNTENGRKGGYAKAANCSESKQNVANGSDTLANCSESKQNVAYKEKENDNDNIKETPKGVKKSAPRFSPPSLDEVKTYIQEKGYEVDAETWWNFYESKGWMVGRNKMTNWHSAVATWAHGSNERAKNHGSNKNGRTSGEARQAGSPKYTDTL